MMARVDEDAKQGAFEMVHPKTFVPNPKLVIVVFFWVGLVIVPLPEINVHKPVPIIGVLAAIVVDGEEIQSVCVVPAFAGVGRSLTSIDTVDDVDAQGGFEITHSNMFIPKPNPVTEVVGESELVIVPLPDINDQVPIPTVAALEFINAFGLVIQTVWLKPAFAIVGTSFTIIATVDADEAHGGLKIVHSKIFVPNAKPVIFVVGESEFVIVPLPEIKVQAPTPTVAALAAIVVVGEVIQSVCVGPAFDTEGISFTTITMVEEDAAHGALEIVHSKTFVPKPKLVIVVFGNAGYVIVPLPETKVHKPVPTIGVFADIIIVGEEMQTV
jgi:hypothetical protein